MKRKIDPRMTETAKHEGDPYENLGNAIIVQATKDYITAIKSGYKRAYEAKSIEKFFRSQMFKLITDIDPEWLIEQLRESVQTERGPIR